LSEKAGIKYVSARERTGYGVAARRYMRGLVGLGLPLTWTPMVAGVRWRLGYQPSSRRDSSDPEFGSYCNADIPYDSVIVHLVPEYYPQWRDLEPGKKLIGYTTWETDVIPRHWPELLNSVDHLMVPCRWNREVMQNSGVTTPISVVPHVGPRNTGSVRAIQHPGIGPDDFVFYSINTWIPRKALWKTVEAYLETFSAADRVVLVLKTTRQDFTRPRDWLPRGLLRRYGTTRKTCAQLVSRHRNPPRIVLLDRELSDQEISALHERGDCFVSLCRSEGWGMGAFDACFHGTPVIMTGYGGQLDYLSESNAYLVRYDLAPVEFNPEWASYSADQHWAEPDLADAGRWMRHVFENRDEARSRGRIARQTVRENYSAEAVCRRMAALALGEAL
jgi:glycosyltransferase involved in cell wall biosynthesis